MGPNKLTMCAGKERLTGELAREIAGRGRVDHRGRNRGGLRGRQAYRCRYCGCWHVGNPAPRDRGKMERRYQREEVEDLEALAT